MQVLVTGANGHIGANVVRAALAAGHEVRAMMRRGSEARGLEGLKIDRVYGDIRDLPAVEAAMRDCEIVINLATPYIVNPADPQDVIGPALESVRNVLQTAAKLGTQKVIHASSMAAIGPSSDPDRLRSEKNWNDGAEMPYTVAKRDSERIAWTLAEALEVPLVTLNPPLVLGRYDYRITPSTRWALDMLAGTAVLPKGMIGIVDVRDLAAAFVSSIAHGRPGERYIIASHCVPFNELAATIGEMTGKPPQYMPAPRPVVLAFIMLQTGLERLLGGKPLASVGGAREWVHRYQALDTSKARSELGYTARPLAETLIETIQWGLYLNAFPAEAMARLGTRYAARTDWTD